MRTRIKYYSYGSDLMTDWFTISPNLIVRGIIHTETNQYTVVEFDSEIVKTDQASSLRSAKSSVRRKLLELGVKLGEEIRVGGLPS